MQENQEYLTKQILTYLGNKRLLLPDIENEVIKIMNDLGKERIVTMDVFSGSGVVARKLKKYSSKIITNDLEEYSKVINECYLANNNEFNLEEYNKYSKLLKNKIKNVKIKGIITENYAPQDDKNINPEERTFYTAENAMIIDSYRKYIEEYVPLEMQKFFLAPLLIEASIHANTGGVFKGFYKDKYTGIGKFGGTDENALKRIKGKIKVEKPILSEFNCEYDIYQDNANHLVKVINDNIDIAYLDPPYNQHPYGSNYFMLNLILENKLPNKVSKISGIPTDWNRSDYNQKSNAINALEDLIKNINAKYLIISYNSEGYITIEKMRHLLNKYGTITNTRTINYYVYKACKNLSARSTMLKEYLFVLRKKEE